MRINRNMLLKLANDSVARYIGSDRTLLAIYLQGSLLSDSPLLGDTADIDLFFIHSDEVSVEREIVRVSDEVHLDISHHSHRIYRQPRELRLHPWLGPTIYGCKILYDPQHFIDFVQASVRGQFNSPQNVSRRAGKHAQHARQMWESLNENPQPPDPKDISLYLRALEHAAQAIAGLSDQILTERRFLLDFPEKVQVVQKSGLVAGFLGLLGAATINANQLREWLPDWQKAYHALSPESGVSRLHPYRYPYYRMAIDAMLDSTNYQAALWPLWRTWTDAINCLMSDESLLSSWKNAGEQLGLVGASFVNKVKGLDAYLDQVEESIEAWTVEHGG